MIIFFLKKQKWGNLEQYQLKIKVNGFVKTV